MMKKVLPLSGLCVCLALDGCGSSGSGSQPSEKKMHDMLSGPPSMAGIAKKPKGAKQGTAASEAGGTPPASAP